MEALLESVWFWWALMAAGGLVFVSLPLPSSETIYKEVQTPRRRDCAGNFTRSRTGIHARHTAEHRTQARHCENCSHRQ